MDTLKARVKAFSARSPRHLLAARLGCVFVGALVLVGVALGIARAGSLRSSTAVAASASSSATAAAAAAAANVGLTGGEPGLTRASAAGG